MKEGNNTDEMKGGGTAGRKLGQGAFILCPGFPSAGPQISSHLHGRRGKTMSLNDKRGQMHFISLDQYLKDANTSNR